MNIWHEFRGPIVVALCSVVLQIAAFLVLLLDTTASDNARLRQLANRLGESAKYLFWGAVLCALLIGLRLSL